MRIAFVFNPNTQGAASADAVEQALHQIGADVYCVTWNGGILNDWQRQCLLSCDLAVVLGGDGTLMHVAKAADGELPILGINGGRIGFLAGLEIHQLDRLNRLIDGRYTTEQRMMLDVTLKTADGDRRQFVALNEAVISRGHISRLIPLEVFSEDRSVITYRADGVIVATPTGSTAYSLSAGGPVVDPALNCMVLTPICPHSMHTRPYLFSDNVVLTITVGKEAYLTVDGEEAVAVSEQDRVQIKRHEKVARTISLKDESAFYDVLTQKLIDRN